MQQLYCFLGTPYALPSSRECLYALDIKVTAAFATGGLKHQLGFFWHSPVKAKESSEAPAEADTAGVNGNSVPQTCWTAFSIAQAIAPMNTLVTAVELLLLIHHKI